MVSQWNHPAWKGYSTYLWMNVREKSNVFQVIWEAFYSTEWCCFVVQYYYSTVVFFFCLITLLGFVSFATFMSDWIPISLILTVHIYVYVGIMKKLICFKLWKRHSLTQIDVASWCNNCIILLFLTAWITLHEFVPILHWRLFIT